MGRPQPAEAVETSKGAFRHLNQQGMPVFGKLSYTLHTVTALYSERSLPNKQPPSRGAACTWPQELTSHRAISDSLLLQKEPRHPAEV